MPRRPREDIRPRIWLPDVRDAEAQARNAVGGRFKVGVYDPNSSTPTGTFITDVLEERLAYLRERGVGIDKEILLFMMMKCALSKKRELQERDVANAVQDGKIRIELIQVGSRVYLTQQQIADACRCSRQHVNSQIQLMRDWYLIVNAGHGWYEFAADLCWRGERAVQAAYIDQQRVNDGVAYIDDAVEMTDDEEKFAEWCLRGTQPPKGEGRKR